MPLAKIYYRANLFDEKRLKGVSDGVQQALTEVLKVPVEDFYQLFFEFPENKFLHTPSFVGMHYSDELIIVEVTFISGRDKDTRLKLLKVINEHVVENAGISPDDLLIVLYEVPGENLSFGQGEAQRASIPASG